MKRELVGNIGLLVILVIVVVFLSVWEIPNAMYRADREECVKWQRWSIEYSGTFYLTPAEADQCRAVGVPELAPIRR